MTADQLQHLRAQIESAFDFDANRGELVWKVNRGRFARKGTKAGTVTPQGYVAVSLNCKRYLAHKLVYFIAQGEWADLIDHIDGNKTNNCPDNLRKASKITNARNAKRHKDNRSGYKGVSLHKASGKYRATIYFDGKQTLLGYFDDPKQAHQAYASAAEKHFRDFARFT